MGHQVLLGLSVGLVSANNYSVANASLHYPDAGLTSAALVNIASNVVLRYDWPCLAGFTKILR